MRFGDPETQPLMMHMDSDLLEIFDMAIKGKLDQAKVSWRDDMSLCVVIAANGYPIKPIKDGEIENVKELEGKYGVKIFYAGVKEANSKLLANGGRVLSICKSGLAPHEEIYAAANELKFADKCFRTDIGRIKCRK